MAAAAVSSKKFKNATGITTMVRIVWRLNIRFPTLFVKLQFVVCVVVNPKINRKKGAFSTSTEPSSK